MLITKIFVVYRYFISVSRHVSYMKSMASASLVILIAAVLLCGCISFPDSGLVSFDEQPALSGGTAQEKMNTPYAESQDDTGAGNAGMDHQVIKTASLEIWDSDVAGTSRALAEIATTNGGYLASSNIYRDMADRFSATVVLRVPAETFHVTLEDIHALGDIRSETTRIDDVTEEYVDLQARSQALNRQLEQYVRIMEKAENVEEILQVQVEIERVQIAIEQITGRIQYLENAIKYATISVSVHEPTMVGGTGGHDFIAVFNEAIGGLLFTVDAVIILFFALLPLILLGAGAYGIYRWRKASSGAAAFQQQK